MAKGAYKDWQTPEKLKKLKWWASEGLSDEQIAENIGISRQTLYTWKNKYSDIDDSIKKGREMATEQVENALFKKSTGYYVDVVEPIKVKETTFKEGKKVKEVEKIVNAVKQIYIPPETGAQVFWLKNRAKEDWKDKVVTESDGSIEVTMKGFDEYAN